MPCEGCKVQFTVFRRKRICADCRRFFCGNCLTSKRRSNNSVVLCERCAIFAKRPLLKIDLAQLKPKDLIFYLQSKHISTTGCVERDELVGLVLNHVNANETLDSNPVSGSSSFSGPSQNDDHTNSFDNIKQTCQNFFTSITDRVDISFDSTKSSPHRSPSDTSSHISDQPRVSVREIPTYSSSEQKSPTANVPQNCYNDFPVNESKSSPTPTTTSTSTSTSNASSSSSSSSQMSSPVISLASICSSQKKSSHSQLSTNGAGSAVNDELENHDAQGALPSRPSTNDKKFLSTIIADCDAVSGCECSDDEIIETFNCRRSSAIQNSADTTLSASRPNGQHSTATNTISPSSLSSLDNQAAGPSGCNVTASSLAETTNTLASGMTTKSSLSLKIESLDESSESSFEDIGATGGGNNSKAQTENRKKNENWQFVKKTATPAADESPQSTQNEPLTVALLSNHQEPNPFFNVRPKKVTRRRSDGYLSRRRYRDDDVLMTNPVYVPNHNISLDEQDEDADADTEEQDNVFDENDMDVASATTTEHPATGRKSCKRCGKTKSNIRKRVTKLQQQLEDSQMSEEDIKRELEEFLQYLENRTISVDCPELTDAVVLSPEQRTDDYPEFQDENEGIHVYADPAFNSRFINLENFKSIEEIQNLSVKQLKEVLMLNRVDYKGCCEKQELLERVIRLWNNLKSCPAVEKLQSDELCKICMDAPIECVILECGHMATCTNCGKVLSECPICRQYIVRVVRFFRA